MNDGATAVHSCPSNQAIKAIPGRPSLIAKEQVIKAAGDPAYDPPHAGGRRVGLTEEANLSLPARLRSRNSVLHNIDFDKCFLYGPPRLVLLW